MLQIFVSTSHKTLNTQTFNKFYEENLQFCRIAWFCIKAIMAEDQSSTIFSSTFALNDREYVSHMLSHLHSIPQIQCYTNLQKSRTEPKQKTQKHATINYNDNDNDRTEHVALLRISIIYTLFPTLFRTRVLNIRRIFDFFRKLHIQRTYSHPNPNFRKTIAPRTLPNNRYTH